LHLPLDQFAQGIAGGSGCGRRSDAYQEQLADALMRGILRYFAANPPLARSRTL